MTRRFMVAYPVGDEFYWKCLDELKETGVTRTKLIRDALTIAFAFKHGRLKVGVLPAGVACFQPKRRTR